jgi:L-ascorbate metabolism protein UlaG (beta-lactamase superfamily)
MSKTWLLLVLLTVGFTLAGAVLRKLEEDSIPTSRGDLRISFVGHASLFFTFDGKVIHVDPVSGEGDYRGFPKADLILITHEHFDHLDAEAVRLIRKPGTQVVISQACVGKIKDAVVMKNGGKMTALGFEVEAVPAYNIVHKRSDGNPFHPKGQGNGYVITFGDKRVYIAGDTEPIPEMKSLGAVDIAFLPMNLPYTMSPEMAAEAARVIKPKILYPYHYGETDTRKLVELLKSSPEIVVRVRRMK